MFYPAILNWSGVFYSLILKILQFKKKHEKFPNQQIIIIIIFISLWKVRVQHERLYYEGVGVGAVSLAVC